MKTTSFTLCFLYYIFITICNILFTYLIAYPLAPILTLFIKENGYFPKWLWWFQTPDSTMDGEWGDVDFAIRHKDTPRYIRRTFWQWRNTAHGFAHFLGTSFKNPVMQFTGNRDVGRLPTFRPGSYFIIVTDDDGKMAFEWSFTGPTFTTKCWNIRCGWKLGNLWVNPKANIATVFRINPFSSRGPLPPQS